METFLSAFPVARAHNKMLVFNGGSFLLTNGNSAISVVWIPADAAFGQCKISLV